MHCLSLLVSPEACLHHYDPGVSSEYIGHVPLGLLKLPRVLLVFVTCMISGLAPGACTNPVPHVPDEFL